MESVCPKRETHSCSSPVLISMPYHPTELSYIQTDFPSLYSNLFGERDPKHYGSTTLDQIEQRVTEVGKELGVKV